MDALTALIYLAAGPVCILGGLGIYLTARALWRATR